MLLSHILLTLLGCSKPTSTEMPVEPANVQETEQNTDVTPEIDTSGNTLAEAAALLTSHDKELVRRAVDMLLKLLEA